MKLCEEQTSKLENLRSDSHFQLSGCVTQLKLKTLYELHFLTYEGKITTAWLTYHFIVRLK